MWPRVDGLRTLELGAPGSMREELTALVLADTKRATAGLLSDYADEELERVGERLVVVDSSGALLTEVEVTAVEVVPFAQVTYAFADAEGEGFESVEHWRRAHAGFWAQHGDGEVDDRTPVVCIWFRRIPG